MDYLAVIADLIHSRELDDRAEAQQKLRDALDTVNERYRAHLASRFSITLGDEFQGLLRRDAPVLEILDVLEVSLDYPFRIGIGYGSMSTAIDPERSIGADGEAYWLAREAIDFIHGHDDYGSSRCCFRGLRLGTDQSLDPVINDLLAATDWIKSNWTPLQRQTFAALLAQGIYQEEFSQKELAEYMGISDFALYKRLKSSQIKLYLRSRSTIQQTIREAQDVK